VDNIRSHDEPGEGPRLCGAKTRAGTPCKRGCVPDRPRCKLHGGMTPKGAEHCCFKDGRFSRYMPKNLNKAYQAAINDPDVLALTDYIGVLQARYGEILGQLDKAPLPPYKRILEQVESLDQAADGPDFLDRFEELKQLARDGAVSVSTQKRCWDQLRALSQEIAHLSLAEHKRRVENRLLVPAAQAVAFVTALGDAVRELVADEVLRERICDKVLEFLPVKPGDQPRVVVDHEDTTAHSGTGPAV
jgi:hypothetical protein